MLAFYWPERLNADGVLVRRSEEQASGLNAAVGDSPEALAYGEIYLVKNVEGIDEF
ncbi:MAG: hypothetical protein JO283_19410 [Bradyrhizobium sp.]|nr:hypothetical protein [Bradyrhizobium sp.]